MMRVAAYTRVSTDEQAKEGFSLPAQEKRLLAYIESQEGWELAKVYRDEGHSGRNIKRPAYQRMMAESDQWDLLLVVKMDRVHRNTRNFMDMVDLLVKRKKEFASASESFDTTTAMGRFVRDLMQRLAQLESEVIGERVFTGMEEKARSKGGSLGGRTPYGYQRVNGMLQAKEPEYSTVCRLFSVAIDRAAAEDGYAAIAYKMNKDARFGTWDRFRVRRILTNPVYAGATDWNGILQRKTHNPVISEAGFNRLQIALQSGVVIK